MKTGCMSGDEGRNVGVKIGAVCLGMKGEMCV